MHQSIDTEETLGDSPSSLYPTVLQYACCAPLKLHLLIVAWTFGPGRTFAGPGPGSDPVPNWKSGGPCNYAFADREPALLAHESSMWLILPPPPHHKRYKVFRIVEVQMHGVDDFKHCLSSTTHAATSRARCCTCRWLIACSVTGIATDLAVCCAESATTVAHGGRHAHSCFGVHPVSLTVYKAHRHLQTHAKPLTPLRFRQSQPPVACCGTILIITDDVISKACVPKASPPMRCFSQPIHAVHGTLSDVACLQSLSSPCRIRKNTTTTACLPGGGNATFHAIQPCSLRCSGAWLGLRGPGSSAASA